MCESDEEPQLKPIYGDRDLKDLFEVVDSTPRRTLVTRIFSKLFVGFWDAYPYNRNVWRLVGVVNQNSGDVPVYGFFAVVNRDKDGKWFWSAYRCYGGKEPTREFAMKAAENAVSDRLKERKP